MSSIGVLRLPQSTYFGLGSRQQVSEAIKLFGTRVFIVVDPFLATTPEFQAVVTQLEGSGSTVSVHTGVEPELPVESLQRDATLAQAFAPDVIVGWGGGSALDAAKLVALLVTHGGSLSDYYGENAVPGPALPLVAVPTTAGTGSEVTPIAVVSDSTRELKVGISSPHLVPRIAVVDPELTVGAPASVTAFSGIDALVHAVESFTATPLEVEFGDTLPVFVGRNCLTEHSSLEAVRLIGRSLERAVAHPGDLDARVDMARGSLLAGIAFGSTGTHLSHAIQYPIGTLTHTPHGLGTGLMLPYVLEACLPASSARIAQIGEALGVGSDPNQAIDRIAAINQSIGVPRTLEEIGVTSTDLPRITELTLASSRLTSIAPIPVTAESVSRLIEAAFTGNRALLND